MDGNGRINLRNWEFLEPQIPFRSHLGLQLMPSMDEKPLFGGGGVREHHQSQPPPVMSSINGGPFHHHRVGGISESRILMDYWMNQSREKYLNNVFNGNLHPGYYQPSNYGVSPETSSVHSIQLPPQITLSENKNVALPIQACNPQAEEVLEETENGSVALPMKRGGGKASKSPSKEKKPRTRAPRAPKNDSTTSVHRARAPKKCAEVFINGVNMDIYGIAIPVCSCTGNPQQCYRWGSGGWQSACCTTSLSMYPLPMSTKRRGARISGRKMSIGAFKKVLEKLASEGYNFSNPIDLRTYWAKHGTNKFVTIR